ncbi:MAG: hypothetical protein NXI32_12115 [bacterium]|nr:hypothetical protein [bacterium]
MVIIRGGGAEYARCCGSGNLALVKSDRLNIGEMVQMSRTFPAIEVRRKTGQERLRTQTGNLPKRLLDSWEWSGSDLINDQWDF